MCYQLAILIFTFLKRGNGDGKRETGVRAIVYLPQRTNPPTGCF